MTAIEVLLTVVGLGVVFVGVQAHLHHVSFRDQANQDIGFLKAKVETLEHKSTAPAPAAPTAIPPAPPSS